MKRYGLIGWPLGHSFSQQYFTNKFAAENILDAQYLNYPLESITDFPKLISDVPELIGLNVTIPYKEKVMEFVDQLDEQAQQVGAVNTIKIIRQAGRVRLHAYNTDIVGFEKSFVPLLTSQHKRGLILGTGGASKAVAFVFNKLGIDFLYVTRTPRAENMIGYDELDESYLSEYNIVINTTPLGTFPKVEGCPNLPYEYITDQHIFFDLVYNPPLTRFLSIAKQRNAKYCNGLQMLHLQAEEAWKLWNG